MTRDTISPSSWTCTILWSTQGGRAKACARRTARLIRDQQQKQQQLLSQQQQRQHLPSGYYGSSFDDYGPLEFFKLGNEPSCYNHSSNTDTAARTNHPNHTDTDNSISKKRRLVIMFVSTTGDAEQCDSIKETWNKLLQRNVPPNQFQSMTFAMFCLGDRAYGPTAFCAAGRKLAARLVQLGAVPYCEMGYGDDGTPNGGVFYDLDVWVKNVLLPVLFGKEAVVREDDNGGGGGGVQGGGGADFPFESPYCVKVHGEEENNVEEKHRSETNNNKDARDNQQEWRMDRYMKSYGDFFSSQCPSTCYFYNVLNGHRVSGSQDRSRKDDPRQGTPLLGRMVSNQRNTAEEWIQDTRHLRIHVKTTSSGPREKPLDGSVVMLDHDGMQQDMSVVQGPQEEEVLLPPYQAGDIATIAPSNPETVVDRFLSCLPMSIQKMADCPLDIDTKITTLTQYSSSFVPWPKHATLRGILTYCADICSLPEREDLRALSFYCNPHHPLGVDQRKKLLSLSETLDAALYGDYILREKRNWADVLFDFDSIQFEQEVDDGDGGSTGDNTTVASELCYIPLSIEHLLMILPAIVPRHFSIASAPSSTITMDSAKDSRGYSSRNGTFGFDLELCVAVVKGKTRYGREYQGLCSSYLANLERSNSYDIRLWIKPGSFGKLPLELDDAGHLKTPIMCIGAGTGVAPLRSLIHEREAASLKLGNVSSDPLPNADTNNLANILVFGCRKAAMDFYYEKEWEVLQKSGNLRLLVAFSQDQKHKIYVQKVLRQADDGLLISRHILENGGAVYIAGGAKMARAIKDEIIECLSAHLLSGEKGARELLQKLQRRGKFCVEAWS
jgi:sulfite reductase alpha subunit-like flavoprotein